ncbi:ATP-binding cassette domain-containing protein [Nocardioides sp. zg-536]|uniref:ATP-binding cassette domain-containing protein n=1 Tax=Nocardioides faecalis TaxID=2803858 RepID=A0A939BS16_9ACTN|nr:branched-chain amino acid ABC transporter permease/ATP-binding protein [Nocardioides faecalis]MBM9459174.1 ATP-binding cassette domain-containing protein [Nocardioides faecalis]QVI59686.1 ATP-binding cassette domain-containing protein [Nocardioides faecalis]
MSAQLSAAVAQAGARITVAGFDFGLDRLLIGLFTGLTYGLLAIGLVLVYRSSRFVNFAHGSIGAFGASILGLLAADWGMPYWLSFLLALVVAGALGAAIELVVVRRLTGRPTIIGMIATLGLSQFILIFALIINADGVSGFTFPRPPLLPTFSIGGSNFGTAHVAMFLLGPALLVALSWFLRQHRVGIAIRAAADDNDAALLDGIPAKRMATLAWALAGGIAAFSAMLVTPTTAGQSIDTLGPDLLLKGLAGAVIARMSSIPIAVVASLGVGLLEQVLLSNPDTRSAVPLALGIIIVVALLRQPAIGRAVREQTGWSRIVMTPLPKEYRALWAVRWFPRIMSAVLIGIGVGLAYVVSNGTASTLTSVAGYALVALSVGLLTGVSGQLSLGQFAYAGIGAAVSVHAVSGTGNFVLGVLCGVIAAAGAAALVGIPAMRLRGLALAVSTLALALATTNWLLRLDSFLGFGVQPAKPTWWGYALELAIDYYLFALLMLILAMWVVGNLRHSGLGRAWQALRDNEDAARAFTVRSKLRKMQIFALSGAIAGLGGAVIGHGQSQLTVNSFPADASIDVVAIAIVGGLLLTGGPILGALIIIGIPALFSLNLYGDALLAIAWLAVVVMLPDGLGGIVAKMRDNWADGVARRAGIDPVRARLGSDKPAISPLSGGIRLEGLGAQRAQVEEPAAHGEGSRPAPILSVNGVGRRFGGVVAVDSVDLEADHGEIVGIIGPNGAGKTTLFEIIAGFTAVDRGQVWFDGVDVTRRTPEQRASIGLVRSFQDAALFPTLTVTETLMLAQERTSPSRLWPSAVGSRAEEKRKAEKAEELIERMALEPFALRTISELSTGTRRVVELASLLALEPRVLLLDEPSAGIAQSESEPLGELLLGIRRELGTTMVVIEHDLPLLSHLCDRMVAMNLGRIIAAGTPDEVRDHPEVVRSYLGSDQAAIDRSATRTTLAAVVSQPGVPPTH